MEATLNKVEIVKQNLLDLNNKFHKKELLSEAFYEQLMQNNCLYSNCLLVSIFPDGNHTYCGEIIQQNGQVIKFDIDLENAKYSHWENITDKFHELYEKNKNTKPWLKEVVSYNLFNELGIATC